MELITNNNLVSWEARQPVLLPQPGTAAPPRGQDAGSRLVHPWFGISSPRQINHLSPSTTDLMWGQRI